MRALIQRVSSAKVTVGQEVTGQIGRGILVLLGVGKEDSEKDVDRLIDKLINLRIFPNEKSHFDKSLIDVGGELLVVSQFTLYGSTKKGRRPDFTESAEPELAEDLYEKFIQRSREKGINTEAGKFGAMMDVELVNEGPVTFMLES